MELAKDELAYLSTWAREERAKNPYVLPAHQLQAAHHVRGFVLIRLIKAWARAENRRDEDIFDLCNEPNPVWPWPSDHEFEEKLQEFGVRQAS